MVGSKPVSVVLDHRGHDSLPACHEHADLCGPRVLDDVGQRLLHDAVERRLDIPGETLVAEAGFELHGDPGLLGERARQTLEGRDEAEVVERLRPQLDRQLPHVLQRLHDELAETGARRAHLLGARGLFD